MTYPHSNCSSHRIDSPPRYTQGITTKGDRRARQLVRNPYHSSLIIPSPNIKTSRAQGDDPRSDSRERIVETYNQSSKDIVIQKDCECFAWLLVNPCSHLFRRPLGLMLKYDARLLGLEATQSRVCIVS